eukprot:gene9280-10072_t
MADKIAFDDAYRYDIEPSSGGWREATEQVKRKVSALTRGYHSMWIGITSGGVDGVRERWNNKYKRLGMAHVAAVYETSSDNFRRNMETELINFYKDHVDNERDGGGGSNGSPPYVVYVAWN